MQSNQSKAPAFQLFTSNVHLTSHLKADWGWLFSHADKSDLHLALFGLVRSSLWLSGGLKPKIIFVPSSLRKHDENLFQSSHRHVGSRGTIRKGFRLGLYDETWQRAMWSTNSCVISWRGGGRSTVFWTTAIWAGDYGSATYESRIDIWGLIMDKSMEPIDLRGKEGVEMCSRVNK